MSKIKMLIADDQELILESLHIVLSMEEDFEIVGLAKNGEEAVKSCEQLQPDIVLMDINMPVMDGVAATAKIKERTPATKVIILTSYREVEYVLTALSHGAEGYLLKAIHPKELAAGIRVVHAGGTLITQEMASKMIKNLNLTPAPQINEYGLSAREIEVLHKLASGMRNQDIAEALHLSEGTVKNYISTIYSKLNVGGRQEAARKARDSGII
ncbi:MULTISPECIES: response regulator transcription factor [Paenibacillus]|jgi:DNA-binding NarL/FixJ family response regulator|uniref:Two component transcriptional regulator, LuxR family n=1 Tax=Paenibacillus barengoltzii J12 TaxID=935846 RepID=A0ABY1M0M8_9BACL|nr:MULTISPECIES: response regulator transcription factor [Paenibacillus]MDU0328945.1 response regulator transcription factor [Paenibacillus sp. 3LSP]MEC2345432.1 response regulator transcription factor [Paenibacillus barengoltzii]SMF48213.1 two component transcriptional regulator, LuxR family [Paenibacillus barengoltzii J12]SMF59565.1 two component transcriptional regulator, LuxR family [Paenibacillus barengoltzii]